MTSLKPFRKKTPMSKCLQALWLMAWLIAGEGVASTLCTALAEWNQKHEVLVHQQEDGSAIYILSHGDSTEDLWVSAMPFSWERPSSLPEPHHYLANPQLNNQHRRHGRCLNPNFIAQSTSQAGTSVHHPVVTTTNREAPRQTTRFVSSAGLRVRQSCLVMRC